jgi:hypothetical protein
MPIAAKAIGVDGMSSAPFAPPGIYEVLGHKPVNVVVVAVVDAVDLAQPSVPTRQLAVTYPLLGVRLRVQGCYDFGRY